MPYVTSDMTAAMRTNVKAIFLQALGDLAAEFNQWQKIATVMTSESDKEEYNWLGSSPPMNEWKDKRQLRGLRPFNYTLVNQSWEATLEINRDAFADNKLGHIPARVRGLTRSYLKRLLEQVFGKLNGGAADNATFDSGFFFKADRTIGDSGTINNIAAGNYGASDAEIRAGFAAALGLMSGFKDDWGKPLGLVPDLVVCSPLMFIPIKQALLMASWVGVARPETQFIKEDPVVSPWLTSGTGKDWYIMCTKEEVKPFIFQERQKPEVTNLDKPDDHDNFMSKLMYYGIDARFTVGFGDPRTCVQIDSAT